MSFVCESDKEQELVKKPSSLLQRLFSGDEDVGWAFYNTRRCTIEIFQVLKAMQGQGAEDVLLSAVEKRMREAGCSNVRLDTEYMFLDCDLPADFFKNYGYTKPENLLQKKL